MTSLIVVSQKHVMYTYLTGSKESIYYTDLGSSFSKKGDYKSAIEQFTKAISLNSNNDMAYFSRSVAEGHLNLIDDMDKDINEAIRSNPSFSEALATRGATYLLLKHDFIQAINDYTKVIFIELERFQRGNEDSKVLLIQAYTNRGISELLLLGDPKNPTTEVLIKYQNIVDDLTKALHYDSDDSEALFWRGWVKIKITQDGCTDIRRAYQLGNERAKKHLAEVCK